jgi:hypothetical protein
MAIRDRPITPRSPWQNGHVERLIGSILERWPLWPEHVGIETELPRDSRGKYN